MQSSTSNLAIAFRRLNLLQQPTRSAIYGRAVKPRMLSPADKIDDTLLQADPSLNESLYKPVAPATKWHHSASTYDPLIARLAGIMTKRGERETVRNVLRLTFRQIKLVQLQKFNSMNRSTSPKSNDRSEIVPSHHQSPVDIELSPLRIIQEAVKNCTPLLVLHSVVRGGILYKVPAPPRNESQATRMALKYLVDAANDKPAGQSVWITLANECIAASQMQGKAYRRKLELHKQCEENRAYANYRLY